LQTLAFWELDSNCELRVGRRCDGLKLVVHQTIGMTIEYLERSGLAAFETLLTRAEATGQTISRTGPPM
jgi:hypothetical protein